AQFGDYRQRPFFELAARVRAERPRTVVDLGCGPGTLTAALARRWPEAEVLGIDSSPEMVGRAQSLPDAPANLRFAAGDIAGWMPAPGTDVIISNAALHWVPGHRDLMARWLAALAPGAWLAVQVPGNFAAPSHALMRSLAASERWAPRLRRDALRGALGADAADEPVRYLETMLDGGAEADVWETTYHQVLHGPAPVLDWVRGTALRPVLAALDPLDAEGFEADYAALLDAAYPATAHGTAYPFRRIFAVGRKR
ncbi:MAG: trans-aconitate 2-methyltransferase, partial [Actinomycetales bacterium]